MTLPWIQRYMAVLFMWNMTKIQTCKTLWEWFHKPSTLHFDEIPQATTGNIKHIFTNTRMNPQLCLTPHHQYVYLGGINKKALSQYMPQPQMISRHSRETPNCKPSGQGLPMILFHDTIYCILWNALILKLNGCIWTLNIQVSGMCLYVKSNKILIV